jgi:NAD(P)-dependent dehydrogenase (short-subunit alcohol dehydrogenase family)
VFSVEGKRVVVTGAGSGIGYAIARLFSEDGAQVLAVDRSGTEEQAAAERRNVLPHRADVSVEADVVGMIERARTEWGGLDVLVNNAGFARGGSVLDVPIADFEAVLRTNLIGPLLGIRHAAPLIEASGGGAIVNMASIAGIAAQPNQCAYVASKGGLLALTRAAALELAPMKISVNAVLPAMTRTPALEAAFTTEQIDRIAHMHPVDRLADPAEIAATVAFLASDACTFATGASFVIDGGRTCTAGWVA